VSSVVGRAIDQGLLGPARTSHARLAGGAGPSRSELVVWKDDVDQAYALITAKGAQNGTERLGWYRLEKTKDWVRDA
jgi:hypothetical protein